MSSPNREQKWSGILNTKGFLHVSEACERMNCGIKQILKIMHDCNVPIPPLTGNLNKEQFYIRESWIKVYEQNPVWARLTLSRYDILPKKEGYLPRLVKATVSQLRLLRRLAKEQLILPAERTRLKVLSRDAYLTKERASQVISHVIGNRIHDYQVNYTLRVGGILDERAEYKRYEDTISEMPISQVSD